MSRYTTFDDVEVRGKLNVSGEVESLIDVTVIDHSSDSKTSHEITADELKAMIVITFGATENATVTMPALDDGKAILLANEGTKSFAVTQGTESPVTVSAGTSMIFHG